MMSLKERGSAYMISRIRYAYSALSTLTPMLKAVVQIALQDVEIAQLSDKIKALTSLSKTIDASSGSDCRDETDTCGAPNSTIA